MSESNLPFSSANDDREKWTQFYNELRSERDRLRAELLKMQARAYHDFYLSVLIGKFESPFTLNEVVDFWYRTSRP